MKAARYVVAILSLLCSASLFAMSYIHLPTDREIVDQSAAIVQGTIEGSYVRVAREGGGFETVYDVRVSRSMKGQALPGELVHVVSPGGEMGHYGSYMPGAARFTQGEDVLLFLTASGDQWIVTDHALGAYRPARSMSGQRLLVRDMDEVQSLDRVGNKEAQRSEAGFLRFIQASVMGRRIAGDYMVAAEVLPEVHRDTRFPIESNVVYDPKRYTQMGASLLGVRWPLAKIATGVSFLKSTAASLSGAGDGGVSVIQGGLASWTNDCGSAVTLTYGGTSSHTYGQTTPEFFDVADGVNVVQYNQAIGGIAGQAQIVYYTDESGSAGAGFREIIDADVRISSTVTSATTGLNSIVTHELGHSIGLRHSNAAPTSPNDQTNTCIGATDDCVTTTNGAMMFWQVSGAGNGFILQAWDIAAIRSVYAGGSCFTKGDFNADSKMDIVLRNYSTGQNAIWLMNGTSLQSIVDLPALPNAAYRIEGTNDFNADNKNDIVLRNTSTGQNAIWILNGTSLQSIVDLPALPNTNYAFEGTGDFNLDGKPDIMLRNTSTGQNALWLLNGTSLLGIVDLPALPNTAYRFESCADFNADGKLDIILRNYSTGQNALWLMNGTSLQSIVDLPALPNTNYRFDAVGDINADGKPDIILRNYATGQNAAWIMNGTSLQSIVDLPGLPNLNYEFNGPR
jgi:hypothetical protein